jgi:hypothetical protein
MKKPSPFILRFLFCLVFTNALIFGAWLGGATPSAWTFALGAVFAAMWASMMRGVK